MSISENLSKVFESIQASCDICGRNPRSITLVGVSKNHPAEAVREAYDSGLLHFGENRLQEALSKIQNCPDDIRWHFIGRIQTNKITGILDHFDMIQSVDRLEVLEKACAHLQKSKQTKDVLLQTRISGEPTKAGFLVSEIKNFFDKKLYCKYPEVKIRGLMGIGPNTDNEDEIRAAFRSLRTLFDELRHDHSGLDTLSMGMTHDFKIAIEEGTTMIRLGTALFGSRISS